MTPWETLGVAPDVGVADLRRRYAALIKEFRPETHAQDFARIRAAYEAVLPVARRREAEAAAAPAAAAPDAPPAVEQASATSDAAIAPPPDAAPRDAGEPDLAERFHRFHELAAGAAGTRDEALLPELRALLQARADASLDDSQALEFALLRRFIESDQPPLTLLFETGRTFDWHLHPARLSSWLSPWALRQMEARLALSRDLVYARHFSGNAWLRRLHSPRNALMPIASRPATLEAQRWIHRWRLLCEDADTPTLATSLDTRTLRRLQGLQFLSTDLIVGLMFCDLAQDLEVGAIYAVVGPALIVALRLALRWLQPEPGRLRLPGRLGAVVGKHPARALALLAGLCLAVLLGSDASGDGVALLLIAPTVLVGLLAIWRTVAWFELLIAEAFAWRDAVDRLEFDAVVRQRVTAEPQAPFGSRLSILQRLRSISRALRLQRIEVATRARPARPSPREWTRLKSGEANLPRMVWIGLWVLFAIARVVRGFSH